MIKRKQWETTHGESLKKDLTTKAQSSDIPNVPGSESLRIRARGQTPCLSSTFGSPQQLKAFRCVMKAQTEIKMAWMSLTPCMQRSLSRKALLFFMKSWPMDADVNNKRKASIKH